MSGGSVQGFSLFFEMNTLFEEYIGRIARRVFRPDGFKVVLQGPQRYLTYDETTEREAFAMKPDVVGLKGNDAAWIIDTKWKELSKEEAKEGVAQGDMYQMYAYSNRYACSDVVLLYPHHEGLGPNHGIRTRYRLNSWTDSQGSQQQGRVTIGTVNLANLATVPNQLRALFHTKE